MPLYQETTLINGPISDSPQSGCSTTEHLLHAKGYRTHTVSLDEFMKSDGSAKCLTLALN